MCLFLSVNDAKGKKKVLGSNQKLKFNPTELILYCKDLRIIRFCFDEAGPESAKKVSGTSREPIKTVFGWCFEDSLGKVYGNYLNKFPKSYQSCFFFLLT